MPRPNASSLRLDAGRVLCRGRPAGGILAAPGRGGCGESHPHTDLTEHLQIHVRHDQTGGNTGRRHRAGGYGEACKILEAVAPLEDFTYERVEFDYGGDRYLASGEVISEQQIDELRQFDAIYLGAIGHPEVKPGILEKGLLLSIRFQLDQYINLRPVKLYPGVDCPLKDKGPEHIRFDVVRENTPRMQSMSAGRMGHSTSEVGDLVAAAL